MSSNKRPLFQFSNKYWRSYPWWLQLILYILMIFTLASFFMFISIILVSKYTGVDSTQLTYITAKSPQRLIDGALIAQVVVTIGVFLLPALLFSYLMTPRPKEFLGLRKPGKSIHWLLVVLLLTSAMPLFLALADLFKGIDLGPSAKAMEEQTNNMMAAFLKMNSPIDFLKVFTCLAILPAIGEEMTFRGILMRFAAKRTRSMVFPIIISAAMFAAMHGNISGLPSIFLAGVLLAVIYYLTGSLWCSMLGHLINNGLQIIIIYLAKDNTSLKSTMENNSLPPYITFISALVFGVSLWLLIKNRTPLPKTWTNDYEPDEMPENSF